MSAPVTPRVHHVEPSAFDGRRWGRVRELRELFGFSKAWVFSALKDGRIKGKKIGDGVLLIDLQSVRDLIERSPDWTP